MLYYFEQYHNIDMNLKIYQKYSIKYLFLDNKAYNYSECVLKFQKKFGNIEFLLSEDITKKIKTEV